MIYELRIYNCLPGRLPVLLKRFEEHTLKLWERHGIEQTGFWTTLIGTSNNDFTYLIRWKSMAEREQRWSAFAADPDWQEARRQSETDRPITANITGQFLAPTRFSALG